MFGRWGTTGLATKPHWSDGRGKIRQPQEAFEPPPAGWKWHGGWEKSPELSIAFEPDEGLDEWTEDVYENQSRYPLANWPDQTLSFWTDIVSLHYCYYKHLHVQYNVTS